MKFILIITLFLINLTPTFAKNSDQTKIKNIIILIGDGMGPGQIGLLELFAKHAKSSPYKDGVTNYERAMRDGVVTYTMTEPFDALVTDSAASATMMSTGKYAGLEMIGSDKDGNVVETVMELAHKKGRATGIISDTRLTHATPASFGSHAKHRSQEEEIANGFAENDFDLLMSGGLKYFKEPLLKKFESKGYELLKTRTDLINSKGKKVLGLFSNSYMPNGIDVHHKRFPEIPTLEEMTTKALSLLSKNKKGFVLMVEAGQIDWTSHANDAGGTLHEMLVMDRTLGTILKFYKEHSKETLVIVTADHETGGFAFSYSTYNAPKPKALSGTLFKGDLHDAGYNFTPMTILDELFSQKMVYEDLFKLFFNLPKKEQRAETLLKMINENGPFQITLNEAQSLLTMVPNNLKLQKEAPDNEILHLDCYSGFYHDPIKRFPSKLAKLTADRSNLVWSTGAHTSTPVGFIALGPTHITKNFKKLLHTTIWGSELFKLLEN